MPQLQAVGIDTAIDSVHDYLIKLSIGQGDRVFGKLKIYHKPTKALFTIDASELRDPDQILPQIRAALASAGVATAGASDAPKMAKSRTLPSPSPNLAGWHLYVDGSYVRGRIGYGVVLLQDGVLRHTLQGVVTDSEAKSVHQIGGELMATMEALRWCAEQGLTAVHIHHDYTGIAFWATGEWKTNTAVTQAYAHFMRAQSVTVTWHKVAAHTGDYWNEMADRLAGGQLLER